MTAALQQELIRLFGEPVVTEADQTDPAAVEMTPALAAAIEAAADRLLAVAGHPEAQRAIVADLTPRLRVLLCLWVGRAHLLPFLTTTIPAETWPWTARWGATSSSSGGIA